MTEQELIKAVFDAVVDTYFVEDNSTIQSAKLSELGDSLDFVELIMALESQFDRDIPDWDAEKWVTVNDIIEYLKTRGVVI